MSNRRENLKKSLGITEYPWSSDEDEINPPVAPSMPEATSQTLPEMHFLHWTSNAPRQSSGTMPGTSGQSSTQPRSRLPPPPPPPPPTASSSSTRPTTCAERDLFWSIINNNPRRTTTINVSRMSSSDIASLTRHTPASELREATVDRSSSEADIQRIMAIKKLTRTYNQRPSPTLNVIVPRNGAMSSSLRNLLSQSRAKELIAKIKATRAKRPHSETTNTADNDLGHSNSRIPGRSGPSLMSIDEADEQQPSTSGLSQPAPAHAELDRVDAPVSSANVNADQSDEEEEILTKITENAEGRNSAAEVSLEEIVEIDAEPSGGHDENHNAKPQPTASAETVENTTPAEEQPHGVKRKFGDEAAEPTIREFNQSLLRLLECPVCMEWLEPPMSQCRRGHLVCARCRARLSACPVCRTAFSSVRNRAMEAVAEMLRYPCKHGCGCELRLRRRAAHEASCPARLYPCPAPACAARPLPLPLLAPHVRSKHLSMVKVGRKHKLSMKVNAEQHSAWVVLALQQLFHLRADVDIRTWAVVIYVAYVGPQRNARNYSYEVSVVGQHNSRKLIYTRSTHSDLESSTLNVSRQDCFHLTLDQAMNFLRLKNRHCVPDKCLDFHVEIRKCEVDNKDDSDSWLDGS